MAMQFPVKNFRISQGFGARAYYYKRFGQLGHNGIDLAADAGEPVVAAESGTIAFEGWGKNHSWMGAIAGISVIIKHAGSHTGYAHLLRTVVNRGQAVKKGQLIGYVGATGTATGPHLHFEVFPATPNFANGYAGRINPMPFLETTKLATEAQVKKAFRDILERDADAAGLKYYQQFRLDFVLQDIANSLEKRRLDARKAAERKAAADKAAREAAERIEKAKKAAEAQAALEAAQKAEKARQDAILEQERIAEAERIAREAAEAKAQSQKEIELSKPTEGGDMTTPETPTTTAPAPTKTPSEASKSATQFVLRIGTQVAAARIMVEGLAVILQEQVAITLTDAVIGWSTIILTAIIIFWSQWGYQLAKDQKWTWAANLKWPF